VPRVGEAGVSVRARNGKLAVRQGRAVPWSQRQQQQQQQPAPLDALVLARRVDYIKRCRANT